MIHPKENEIMTESLIQEILEDHYKNNSANIIVSNIYAFRWESDLFILDTRKRYTTEIEIKISKIDFKKDSEKKDKHCILKNGYFNFERHGDIIPEKIECSRPNKFYYCVPENLIDLKDVPDYAGLFYIVKKNICRDRWVYSIKTVRRAPFIHKETKTNYFGLMQKFYIYWKRELRNARYWQSNYSSAAREVERILK
jgi:hypothetical protein